MPDIDDIWDDDEDMLSHPLELRVVRYELQDLRAELEVFRDVKSANGRPSNHHGSNPRRSE
jgi:hypothetical protein